MPSLIVRCLLFLSSYFPLLLIFGIFLLDQQLAWAIALFALGLLSLTMLVFYLSWHKKYGSRSQDTLVSFQRRDSDVMAYIASYLIPFVTFPLAAWQQITALVIFVSVLLVIYINSNLLYINPMLNIVGFHLYEVHIEHSKSAHFLIARRRIEQQSTLYFVRLNNEIFLERSYP